MVTLEYGDEGVSRFLTVALYVASGGKSCLPAGDYAYIYHKGTYEDARFSYRLPCDFIQQEALVPIGPVTENVLMDHLSVGDEEDYLVEIMIQITPGNNSGSQSVTQAVT